MRVLLVGDVMTGRGVASVMQSDPNGVFAGIRHLFAAADVVGANLESPLTDEPHISANENVLEADPATASVLAEAGFDLMSLPNNHSSDAGPQGLLDTLAGSVADGKFLDEATATYPTAVLGSVAAERLGIREVSGTQQVWLGDQWFTVIGVLDEFELNPDLDRAALIGVTTAEEFLGQDVVPSSILVRVDPDYVDDVTAVLSATANPQNPEEVEVSRPSDALEAKEAADDAFTALFLGLGAVALLVGGVGIANVMVISVLERRSEIGLRRALGATKRHVALQFLGEALLLSAVGGIGGVALGWAVTGIYANVRGWNVLVPPLAIGGGLAAAILIGAIAGLYPAVRAARLSPTEALRSA